MVVLNRRSLFNENVKGGTGHFALWLVMTFYCLFYAPPAGDNFSSLEKYASYMSGVNEAYLHLEPIYFRMMDITPSYLAYRFLNWGGGCLLLVLLLRRLKLDAHVATIAVLFFCINLLYYQRACPAYAMLYWSMYLLVVATDHGAVFSHKRLYLLLGLTILPLTLPFHTTMPFYIMLVLISVVVPKSRLWIVFSLIGVLAIATALPYFISGFLENLQEKTVATAEYYLDAATKRESANALGLFVNIITQSPFYIMLAYFLWNIDSPDLEHTKMEKCLLVNTLLLIAAGLVIAVISDVIKGKFFIAAQLPWGLYLASLYSRKRTVRPLPLFVKILFWTWLFGMTVSITSGSFFRSNYF